MKNFMLMLALCFIAGQVSAAPIIQCRILKSGKSIGHSLSLNQRAKRDFSSIWGPSKSKRFYVDKSGETTPMTLNMQLDGENLLAVSLFEGQTPVAQRRQVISSSRPFSFYVQATNRASDMAVSCARN